MVGGRVLYIHYYYYYYYCEVLNFRFPKMNKEMLGGLLKKNILNFLKIFLPTNIFL